jgi:hypothetical protein
MIKLGISYNKLLTAGVAAVLTAGILAIADARTSATRCNDKGFFGDHPRRCTQWFEFGIWRHVTHLAHVVHHPRPKIEFPPVQSYEMTDQSVTVTRDRQASNDSRPDQYISLQTAEDMVRSAAPYGFAGTGWSISIFDMGRKHPPLYAPAVRKTVAVVPPQLHPSESGGGYYNAHPQPHIDK